MGVVFDKPETTMELNSFATLSAIKGKQFGKEIYSSVIRFEDLRKFLEVFPSVQRDIIPKKVKSLRKYIISGLENREAMRFFSAITVSCRGTSFYDEVSKRIAIDTISSKLSVNDGQHRFEAICDSIEHLENEYVKSKDKTKSMKIRGMIDELKDMVIPIVIFSGLDENNEKQLFHDLNNLAQRPSRNANIRLNQTEKLSIMARELAEENRYLKHLGVEFDKMSIHMNNPNTILLSTIYESAKELMHNEYKTNNKFLNDENYNGYKDYVNNTFDKLFYALPHDLNNKGKYIIEKSFALKAISRFIYHARNHLDIGLTDEQIFDIIGSHDWTYNIEFWKNYGGTSGGNIRGVYNNILFSGGLSGGFKAVYNSLIERAIEVRERENQKAHS